MLSPLIALRPNKPMAPCVSELVTAAAAHYHRVDTDREPVLASRGSLCRSPLSAVAGLGYGHYFVDCLPNDGILKNARARRMKRDNAYYEPLLKRKFPKIHKDFVEGRYPSLRRALIAAGIKKEFSTGEQLQRLWAKASAKEQGEFRAFIAPKATAMIAPGAAPAFRSDGSFEPWARDRVKEIMDRRGIKTGTICSEIGIPPLSPSIGLALNQKSRIRDTDTRAKLEKWIADNGHV